MMKDDEILWWGYRHVDGTLHLKRYFDVQDLIEARESPFVEVHTNKFEAPSREDAMIKLKKFLP